MVQAVKLLASASEEYKIVFFSQRQGPEHVSGKRSVQRPLYFEVKMFHFGWIASNP